MLLLKASIHYAPYNNYDTEFYCLCNFFYKFKVNIVLSLKLKDKIIL